MTISTQSIQNFYTPEISARIKDASISTQALLVTFSNEFDETIELSYPWSWVRDHCIDTLSLDQNTIQRKVDTFSLPSDLQCRELQFDRDAQLLHFTWSDNSRSTISAYVLAAVSDITYGLHELRPEVQRVLWDKDSPLTELPRVEFDQVMESDEALLDWLEKIHVYGFSMVHGVPSSVEGTTQLALRLGHIQETIFGGFWPLSSELTDHGDTAYSNTYLEPHTDGTYYDDAAGLQMFNCIEIDCEGGRSIQLDGFAIAEKIRREEPEAFQLLSEIVVPAHYIEQGVHLHAERPTFKLDSKGRLQQVSFNNYDRAPMLLDKTLQDRFYQAYGLLHKHVIDEDNWLQIDLVPGTTLIFDNWRNMHGRTAFRGSRYFYGCYHSRAVFESKLRVLQAQV